MDLKSQMIGMVSTELILLTNRVLMILISFTALDLMSYSAVHVMEEFREIILSFGQSDEYSFIFHKSCDLYNRRQSKIMSCVNSLFTSAYVAYWNEFLPETPLQCLPSFDARIVLYPSDQNLKDYLSWRQADVHINNLYNTCFWNLVQKSGLTNTQAEEKLRGTFSSDKNELLFSDYGINYNNLDPMFRKGTILLRKQVKIPGSDGKTKQLIIPFYEDMIREDFWKRNDELLERGQSKFHAMDETNVPGLVQKQIMKLPR